MRLTCPRCGAQYEIDGAEIPAAGRTVECTACGNTWRHVPDEARPLRLVPAAPAPEITGVPEAFDAADRPVLNRPLNESVLSILREEAGREISARRRDAGAADAGDAGASGVAEEADEDDDDPDYSPPPLPAPGTDPATDAATRIPPLGVLPMGDDALWPATTLTHPAPPVSAHILASRLEDELAEEERDGVEDRGAARDEAGGDEAGRAPADPGMPAAPAGDGLPVHGRDHDRHEDHDHDRLGRPAEAPQGRLTPDTRPVLGSTHEAPHEALLPPSTADPRDRSQMRTVPQDYAVPTEADPADAAQRRRRAYDIGFGLVLLAALLALALYALAPRIADQGVAGARLMEWRAQADQGRAWLQARAHDLLDLPRR